MNNEPTNDTANSTISDHHGLDMFVPDIIVVAVAAIRSCSCMLPTGVLTTLSNPDAVIDSITILPDKSGSGPSCNG